MNQPNRPHSAERSNPAAVWAGFGVVWLIIGLFGLVWCAGRTAAWIVGHGWTGPDFGFDFAKQVVRVGPAALWPGCPPALVWGLTIGYPTAAVALAGWAAWRIQSWWRNDPKSKGGKLDVAAANLNSLTVRALARDVGKLCPDLAGIRPRRLRADQVGYPVGRHHKGLELRGSHEDCAVVVMAPRAGKTRRVAAPILLDAPGPVVATSSKADLWALTQKTRVRRGQVWTFDPGGLTGTREPAFVWNPLTLVTTWTHADRIAGNFSASIEGAGGDNRFFLDAAHDLITSLVFAAALAEGTLLDVARWLDNPTNTPEVVLATAGQSEAAARLKARREMQAKTTRDGIWEVARTMTRALAEPSLRPWLDPALGSRLPVFDPAAFAESTDTLYLLSRQDHGGVGPVVAAYTDQALHTADVQAGPFRLSTPMYVVLDEVANICRIPHLPALYSTCGSKGIVIVSLFQSRPQGRRVWGDGFDEMWSAATIKLAGTGLDDPGTLADMAVLIGDHDRGDRDGKPLLPAARLRSMPKGTALLLAAQCPAVTVELESVHDGRHRREVEVSLVEAEALYRASMVAPVVPMSGASVPVGVLADAV